MSEHPDGMLSWLREQILARKARAEAVPQGPWHVERLLDGYPQRVSNAQAIVIAQTYEGGDQAHIADHIAAHDPQDTIARCEAELALLDEFERCGPATQGHIGLCGAVQYLASGYRHRDGWKPEWAPEIA